VIRPARLALAAGLTVLAASAIGADNETSPAAVCAAPRSLGAIAPPLTQTAARIERGEKVTIVAIGSSSTQGTGASAPALSYPSRLAAELRQRFPRIEIAVINRGKGGEDARQELNRFERDVIAERPDLVIWQLGTNAVLRRDDVSGDGELIRGGIAQLKEGGSDVVLMDMQYAPRVLARPHHAVMERLIAEAAEREHVGLFRRFDIMRYWQAAPIAADGPMIGSDGLHMTDRGYGCLAAGLAEALTANWRDARGILTAAVSEAAAPRRQTADRVVAP
jgi:acyl-CoA thioesterase I